MSTVERILARPRPPEAALTIGELAAPDRFMPAPEVETWVRSAFLEDDGPLYWDGHGHLRNASIGVLWTTALNVRKGRRIIGQAEMPERMRSGPWEKARFFSQLRGWFWKVPDFLITLDAIYAFGADDAAFCALIDHELCHCAQATDEFGMPKFNKVTGEPSFALRGHDVEEFVSVVRRFGIEAAGENAVDLVIAAAQKPAIAPARLAQACGTCLRLVA